MIKDLLKNSENLIQLIIAIIVISLGINLLSGVIAEKFIQDNDIRFWVSISLIILPLFYILYKFLAKRHTIIHYQSILLYNSKDHSIVSVPRFDILVNLAMFIKGIFLENLALKKMWEKDGLINKKAKKFTDLLNPKPHQLLNEVIEFYFLRRLSMHLESFFNNKELDKGNIIKFKREDLPEFLLKNRVFELFTKPYEERIKIVEKLTDKSASPIYRVDKDSEDEGEILTIITPEGGIYNSFELKLPKKSKITKNNNIIEIDTPGFIIKFMVNFEGIFQNLPPLFKSFYLKKKKEDRENIESYQLDLYLTITYKFAFTLKPFSLNYHNWLDSFIEEFDNYADFKTFIKKINWDSNLTLITAFTKKLDDSEIPQQNNSEKNNNEIKENESPKNLDINKNNSDNIQQ